MGPPDADTREAIMTQPSTTPRRTPMTCRAISRRTAEYLAYAPALAGGYVAVDGPRIQRIDASWYRELREVEGNPDASESRREDARRELEQYHQLPRSGDYARIAPKGHGDDHVLVVPADHPIAQHGYA